MTQDGRDLPILDPAALERLRSWGGDGLRDRMIELFLELGPSRIRDIRTGLENGSVEQVERAAHSLKSSAGNLGADELRAVAHRLEKAAMEKEELTALNEPADRLVEAYERVVDALERILSGAPSESQDTEP